MVSTTSSNSASSSEQSRTPDGAGKPDKPLDILFLQDTTGSQGPYIIAARKAICDICAKILASPDVSQDLLRFGLIAFRDHPPMDVSYVTKDFGFTANITTMERHLAGLTAVGGGDGPEAQTAALAEALGTQWKDGATKIVILVTDSPPHGLGEQGDSFDKSPDQNDPLDIARQMAEHGVTLFVVACEPTLSASYIHALDFYSAITQITGGYVLPLMMAEKLGDYIVGTVLETVETERLIQEFEKVILDDVYNKSQPMEAVAQNIQQFIADRGVKITTMNVENIYNTSDIAQQNQSAWMGAANVTSARQNLQRVTEPRIQQQFMQAATVAPSPPLGVSHPVSIRDVYKAAPAGLRRSKRIKEVSMKHHIPASSPGMAQIMQQQYYAQQQQQQQQHHYTQYQQQLQSRERDGNANLPALSSAPADRVPVQMQMQMQMSAVASIPSYVSQAQMPAVSYGKASISQQQAARIVQQAISRNSKVTSAGYVSRTGGQSVAQMQGSKPS